MPRDLTKVFESIDIQIRSGALQSAQQELTKIYKRAIPRSHKARGAHLAWRVGLPQMGLRSLYAIVNGSRKTPPNPTDEEKIQYAVCLLKIGAIDEAGSILEGIDTSGPAEGTFYRAAFHISRWEYGEAVPFLQKFLNDNRSDDYKKLVARVNLAECLVVEKRYETALPLLEELSASYSGENKLAVAKSHEILAQLHIARQEWGRAEELLRSAETMSAENPTIDGFFIKKWRAIASFLKSQSDDGLLQVRKSAEVIGHWETMRQIDAIYAQAKRNERLLWHVYFGSPFEIFRKRLLGEWGTPIEVPPHYSWKLKAGKKNATLNLGGTTEESRRIELQPGRLPFRLLRIMCSDFYRPFRVAALHHQLYPDEKYNPDSSPARVHDAFRRLRTALRSSRIPIEIATVNATSYQVSATGPVTIIVPKPGEMASDHRDHKLIVLTREIGNKEFTAAQAADVLHLPRRTVFRILSQGVEEGQLDKIGSGKNTRYQQKK